VFIAIKCKSLENIATTRKRYFSKLFIIHVFFSTHPFMVHQETNPFSHPHSLQSINNFLLGSQRNPGLWASALVTTSGGFLVGLAEASHEMIAVNIKLETASFQSNPNSPKMHKTKKIEAFILNLLIDCQRLKIAFASACFYSAF